MMSFVLFLAKEGLTPHVLVVFPMPEVGEVGLVLVGFLLEADVAVGLHAVTVFDEQDEPLEEVPDEERHIEQLPLLGGMDEFMVEFHGVERLNGKDEAEQADGQELLAHRMPLDEINPGVFVLLHS